jgi:predicted RNase H-like HicB family nuclease
MERMYIVTAFWDAEAHIWVAESDDVPGLATGAATLDELVDKLNAMIPELLELNSHLTGVLAPQFEVRATKNEERLTLIHAFA